MLGNALGDAVRRMGDSVEPGLGTLRRRKREAKRAQSLDILYANTPSDTEPSRQVRRRIELLAEKKRKAAQKRVARREKQARRAKGNNRD